MEPVQGAGTAGKDHLAASNSIVVAQHPNVVVFGGTTGSFCRNRSDEANTASDLFDHTATGDVAPTTPFPTSAAAVPAATPKPVPAPIPAPTPSPT